MVKHKKIIFPIAILIAVVFVSFIIWRYCNIQKTGDTFNKRISHYIENSCYDLTKCQVNISDFTDFEWDTMCFDDVGSPRPELIPAPLPEDYGFPNGKMLFISQNKVVFFEEIPLEGFEPPRPGTVLVDTFGGLCYPKDETLFNVEKNESYDYYTLYNKDRQSAIITEYRDKINNPEKYLPGFLELSPEQQEIQIESWQKIVDDAEKSTSQ